MSGCFLSVDIFDRTKFQGSNFSVDILDRTICLLITNFSSFDGIQVRAAHLSLLHSSLRSFCFSYVCSSKLYHNNSLLLIIPEQTIKSFISSASDFHYIFPDLHYIFVYFNIYICFWEEKYWYLFILLPNLGFILLPYQHFKSLTFYSMHSRGTPHIYLSRLVIWLSAVSNSLPFLHCRLFNHFYSHLSVISLPSNLFCLISYDFVLLMYEGKFLTIHLGWMQPLNLSFDLVLYNLKYFLSCESCRH